MVRGGSKSLERKDEALGERALLEVLRQVDADRGISTLRLTNAGLSPSLAVQLADFLEKNATLTLVDLSGNDRMGSHGVSCLAESLAKNSTLRTLSLARCKLSSDALDSWAEFFRQGANKTLHTIDLSSNQIQDDGVENIAVMVETARTRGVALDLRSNELSDASMQRLAEALKPPRPYVVALRLENNQDEGDADVYRQRIEYYLKRNAGVMRRACLLDRIAQIVESALAVSTCHIDHETLSLSDADALSLALKDNVSITDLRLRDNGLPQEATKRIVNALRGNKSVSKLAIVDNNIGDSGFLALSTLLRSPASALRSLKVANAVHLNEHSGLLLMAPRTASALHYTFASFSLLTTLSLSNCALDDVLVGAIASGVARGARIESLALPFNRISDRSVHVFAHLMARCQLLRHLDLANNRFTLVGLLPLADAIATHPRLRSLLLGRFPTYDSSLLNESLLQQLGASVSLVRVELSTVTKRSLSTAAVTELNSALAQRHASDAEAERHVQVLKDQAHTLRCHSRALVRQAARVAVAELLASIGWPTST